ncbi:unnamed protein product [Adineta ricciae]|uniref:Trafficking protein particle complex subunit 8 n=1 Tax=Adineta ricciae TaxID=249248 RepID=A0A816AQI9_ADIRI|nr:unnamed protein product [Adineta ricciae]CAF1600016.1 unnamed protein product [Adineta ricciae]
MAQTKKSVSEFIQDAFCPMITVLCSYDAESICRKNNLTFAELIQPFCRLPSEVSYRDPSNNLITLKNLRLEIKDFNALPPQNTLAKKLLNDSVSNALNIGLANNDREIHTEQYHLHVKNTTPWFDAWRDCFLRITYNGEHEFLKNYLACVMVVSTSHLDPMDAFAKLVQQQSLQQQQSPAKLPKWFMPNIYKYFVLLHDVTEGEESKAVSVFADLKQQYGAGNCHLLQINSKRAGQTASGETDETTNMPDPWRLYVKQSSLSTSAASQQQQQAGTLPKRESAMSDSLSNLTELIDQELNLNTSISHPLGSLDTSSSDMTSVVTTDEGYDGSSINSASTVIHGACLTLSDHDRIHVFMNEFVTKGLLLWVETNLKTFNEQITSRRGFTKIFSMPKKFFGGNTSTTKNTPSASSTNLTNDSMEIVLRRAGDLAFLFQSYEFAYNNYYAAKRDLSREQAPTFYAGVLEMCCLANFMQDTSATKVYPGQYMDEAIEIYANVSRLPIFATRCVLMSTEILKSKEAYDQAVQQFLKLSQEDSDLRGALFLEQASHCYLNYRPPYIRKYAFYMVIAGHRFLKAGQRLHALRCYNDVLDIYGIPNWSLALDHVNFTLGKQSALLNHSADAIRSFNALFAPHNRIQNAQQQINFFKEYLTVFNQLTSSQTTLPELPVPLVDNSTMKVLLSGPQQAQMGGHISNCNDFDFDETREIWTDLERAITIHDRRPSGTRTQMSFFTSRTHNQQHPIAIANETIRVEFYVQNVLQVPLLLSEVQILWKHSLTGWKRRTSSTGDAPDDAKEHSNDTLTKQTNQPVECDILSDCVIFANDNSKIELSLRPLRPGYLTILGICYRLNILVQNISDQTTWPYGIMGKALFHVKGIRLNSNRKERLNVMYGVDKRLELQVVPEAPLLHIEFSPMPTAMFCGEIHSCLVHLINRSTTHAINHVRLTTNQPSLITISSSNEDSLFTYKNESQSIWNHSLNHQSSILTLVNQHHPLEPNSTRTVRLWLRASHLAGEMNIDFLFVYESDVFQQPLRHRTVKHSSLFIISHSIGFNTQAQSTGLGQLMLPVQIDNLMATPNTLSINIQQLSCVSKNWHIHYLALNSKNSIRYGESLSLLFKCTHKENEHHTLQMKHIDLSADETKKDKFIDISQNPIGDFFRHFIFDTERSLSTHRHKQSNPLPIPPISLVLLWQIAMSNQLGQIELRHGLHMVSPSVDTPNRQPGLIDAIQYELMYPSVVEHTFTKALFLPVQLKIFNRTNEQIDLQLQLSRSSFDSDPLLSSCCLWSGMTEQFLHLSAYEHLSLTLRACFFKPGFYSLGNIVLAIVDKIHSTTKPIKSNTHNYFVDIRTVASSSF